MKYCQSCGSEMHDEAVMCVACGVQSSSSKLNSAESNGIAIGAIICAFVFALAGVILGVVGLGKYKGVNDTAYKMCIAAIILAVANMVCGFILNAFILGPLLDDLFGSLGI